MKTMEEIYEALRRDFVTRAGMDPGESCDLSVRLYALSAQLQALEIQAEWVLDQSFPQTAQGLYLDRHAAMRGIRRAEAGHSEGKLRFSMKRPAAAAVSVPAGTVCMTADEVRYETTEEGIISPGGTETEVAARSLEGGAGTNAAPHTVTILTACPVAITACTNPEAFLGGCDAESDAALRQRVLESYRRLPNGANAAYYEYAALQHKGVAAARAVGRARGIGTVDVYVAAEAGAPSEALLGEVERDLQKKREIAVDVQVRTPVQKSVNLEVQVAEEPGTGKAETLEAVRQALTGLFSGRLLGRGLRLAEIGNRIYETQGVANYRILQPTGDLPAEATVLPVLGNLQVTELGGS